MFLTQIGKYKNKYDFDMTLVTTVYCSYFFLIWLACFVYDKIFFKVAILFNNVIQLKHVFFVKHDIWYVIFTGLKLWIQGGKGHAK